MKIKHNFFINIKISLAKSLFFILLFVSSLQASILHEFEHKKHSHDEQNIPSVSCHYCLIKAHLDGPVFFENNQDFYFDKLSSNELELFSSNYRQESYRPYQSQAP